MSLSHNRRYRPVHAPYYGALLSQLNISQTGAITANATTTIFAPIPAYRGFLDEVIRIVCQAVAADADGTTLLTLYKRDVSAPANVALTGAFNIEGLTTLVPTTVPLLSTLTEADVYFDTGDYLFAEIVNNSAAIDTQPSNLRISAGFFVSDP